jgi:hypothetical protein
MQMLNLWEKVIIMEWPGLSTVHENPFLQGCGSGLDPDSVTLWIWIRIGNPDPDPGARKLRNFSRKNTLFS